MVPDPESDVGEGLFTVFPEIFKRCVNKVHIINERLVDFVYDFLELAERLVVNRDFFIQ